jgi:hypothetical protein
MTARAGHCLCGAVTFTAQSVESTYGACHCEMCQRWAGSALLAVTVKDDQIAWAGGDAIATFQSSDWAERGWCAKCGSGLWYRMTAEGPHKGAYQVPIGLFDDANGFTMDREIFIDKKPDAFAFAGTHEMLTEAQVFALYGVTTEGA